LGAAWVSVEDANGAEVLEDGEVVVREVEAAVGNEPAGVRVGAKRARIEGYFGVGEGVDLEEERAEEDMVYFVAMG
jgi:hypothetical protein